jgi:hypothetical protein
MLRGGARGTGDLLARCIERGDYLRGSPLRLGEAAGHKEWLHFCVYADGLDVLVNFSLVDDLAATQQRPLQHARLTCLLHDQHGWDGDVVSFSPDEVRVQRGYIGLKFADNEVYFRDGVFYIRAQLPERGIAMELILTPVTIPAPANNIDVEDGPPIHWIVVPRLLATGHVQVRGQSYALRDAVAYHDHNWGHFRWGRDFAWEWGYGLPSDSGCDFSLVFVRLSNRSHSQVLMQAIFLWRGLRQFRVFRDEDVQVTHSGLLRAERLFKLPRVMALVAPGTATDVPATLSLLGQARGDRADVELTFGDVAQVIIPNDDDLGVTIIHEVNGTFRFEGTIRGERISMRGRAVVEFLGN